MCWCKPEVETPFCNIGPCNREDITRFQNIIAEFDPSMVGGRLFQIITEDYAKDFKTWEANNRMIQRMKEMGESIRNYHETMIFKYICDHTG